MKQPKLSDLIGDWIKNTINPKFPNVRLTKDEWYSDTYYIDVIDAYFTTWIADVENQRTVIVLRGKGIDSNTGIPTAVPTIATIDIADPDMLTKLEAHITSRINERNA